MKFIFFFLLSWYRKLQENSRILLFVARGKKPWTKGYFEYKWRMIERAIHDKNLMDIFTRDASLPAGYGVGIDERIVEFPWVLSHVPEGQISLLDAGSALNFFSLIKHPRIKNKNLTIITLAPETNNFSRYGVSYVYGDIRGMSFQDNTFDCVTCISTLEHVGLDNTSIYTHDQHHREDHPDDYLQAVKELYRVLKSGGQLLITVPFGVYDNIGFMQQFTSAMVDAVINACSWQTSLVTYYHYSADGWNISTRQDAQSVVYFNIHRTKHIESDHAAAARAVACMLLTK